MTGRTAGPNRLVSVPLERNTNSFARISRTMGWFWDLKEDKRNKLRQRSWGLLKQVSRRKPGVLTTRMLLRINCLDVDCNECPAAALCLIEVEKIEGSIR